MPRIFISQRRVQQLTEEGKVHIEGNLMTLPELHRTFKLTEAFFIQRTVADGGDPHRLAGRVKTRVQLAALGGEVFLNSLVIGDSAYEGDPGFLGEPSSARARSSSRHDAPSGRVTGGASSGTSRPQAQQPKTS